jgi:hypothetical protein
MPDHSAAMEKGRGEWVATDKRCCALISTDVYCCALLGAGTVGTYRVSGQRSIAGRDACVNTKG